MKAAEGSSLNDPRQTAIHEAGHAVIARVLTLDCGGATIKPDHDSAAHAITNDPWACIFAWEQRGKVRNNQDAVWHARIMSFMAGAEAEVVLLGSAQGDDGEDRYQIDLMADQLDNIELADWIRLEARLRALTRALIRRHRKRIERVAEALLAKGSLSGKAIDELAGRSVDDVKVNAPFLLAMANDAR
jgi:ATP-dependent Zn protease